MNTKTLLVLGAVVGAASAQAVTFNLNTTYTGPTPGGAAPWLTVTITDVAANKVNVNVAHNATSAAGQFFSDVFLNLDPFVGGITVSNEVNAAKRSGLTTSLNGINGGGGTTWDMNIAFVTSNAGGGVNRLKPGEFWSGDLTGAGLSEASFMGLNNMGFQIGAHIQGLPNGQSAHITTPEPGTIAALGLGAVVLLRRRKKA